MLGVRTLVQEVDGSNRAVRVVVRFGDENER